jgi:hypothetical protein
MTEPLWQQCLSLLGLILALAAVMYAPLWVL